MGVEENLPLLSKRNHPRYENTYRLESKNPFLHEPVENIIRTIISARFNRNSRYNASEAPQMVTKLSQKIREKVKELNFERYRLIVLVSICENHGQSGLGMMKCLWDPERDSFASYTFETEYLIVYGVVIGIYYE
ncbi:dynein light chain Tctex-type 5-A [Chrysoperla carnea]|uniref:dynein light chain Tctex-type 5-A n=1 Tax=Chrysoperla carnea TaxID=189513 RepID=UPI001D08D24E|nr:dynein light chain Tctex-type 5-A [Chrysoperla carnea]